jgi:Nucleoside 2-deoxyribosyltransferase like
MWFDSLMVLIKAPNDIPLVPHDSRYLFLAGSIEMGAPESWQSQVCDRLRDTDWTVLNPRRDDWDSSWVESKGDSNFREQVDWELNAQEMPAVTILMYLAPGTESPISLLEFGLFARTGRMLVICPEGFWKKGNVDVVCERYGVKQFDSIDDALEGLLRSNS